MPPNSLINILNENDSDSPSLFHDSDYYDIEKFTTLVSQKDSRENFSLYNTNARSLLKHKSEYEILFQALRECSFDFDLITFTESWLNDDLETLADISGYTTITKHKTPNKEGGGIAAYLKDSIKFQLRPDLQFPNEKENLYSGIFIEIINSDYKNILVFIIYRSPSHNSICDLTTDLNNILDRVKHENKSIIITGDLNIDLLKYSSHPQTTQYTDMLISNNLIPNITKPTRVTHTSATLIDHIFSNIDPSKSTSGTLKTDITDHYSNFFFFKTKPMKAVNPKYITFRKQDIQSLKNFENALTNTDWTHVLEKDDPNDAYNCLSETYTGLMDRCLPLTTKRFNKLKHKKEPWITPGILKSLHTKEKLYLKMIKSKNTQNFEENRSNYANYVKLYKRVLRQAKAQHWQIQFEKTKRDMKQTWKNINKVLQKTQNKQDFPDAFLLNGNEIRDSSEIAKQFNIHYTSIGPTLASQIPSQPENFFDYLDDRDFPNSLYFAPCNPSEITNIIKCLQPKTSSGYDNISPRLLKYHPAAIAHPLAHIANLSMEKGVFPTKMKIAKVIPIYKKDNRSLFINYRPISLLPSFSKILEKLIHKRLMKYLSSHNILIHSQYGFQPNLSTELAILELQDRIIKKIASKHLCLGLSIDLSKAFNTLNHDILLLLA
jgi:hypothetical protein